MLTADSLSVRYGKIEAVKSVSLRVEAGEIVAILGANGAGKSSLLSAICGGEKIAAGSVTFCGKEITNFNPEKTAALGMAYVPEGRRIFPGLSVKENLEMGGYLRNAAAVKNGLERMFNLFPVLRDRAPQKGGTLSGGEQQMLAIARGLMGEPKLLLLDEPSLGLSPKIEQAVFLLVKNIRDMGTTVLLVEQNANLALKIADRGYVMENGAISLAGPAAELLNNNSVQKAYLGV